MKTRYLFITGANSKLGQVTAEYLLQSGYNLILHYRRDKELLLRLKEKYSSCGQEVRIIQADLTLPNSEDSIADYMKQEGLLIQGIICNAALFYPTPFREVTREDFDRFFLLNLVSQFFLVRALLPLMSTSPVSSVVLFADIYGIRPIKNYLPYCISKAGVIALTRGLAKEIAPVRVNAIAPGAIEFTDNYSEQEKEQIINRTLLKRKGEPEEIARTVKFLLENQYITGQVLAIDGGKLLM